MPERDDTMSDDKTRETFQPGSCSIEPDATDCMLAPEESSENVSVGRWLFETLAVVVLALLLATGIKTYVMQPFLIPSGSMEPTLQISDRVLADKLSFRLRQPEQGDVVVFLSPDSGSTDYIKRVIAVGGQTVDIRNGAIYVDGKRLSEPYTHGQVNTPGTVELPITIPDGYVWLMGDNRSESEDSRWFGAQPVSRMVGRAMNIYWPLSHIAGL